MNFKSEYEAYTYMLIKRDELKKQLDNTDMQMAFLLMNIREGNFKDLDSKRGAMQELDYLISSSGKVSDMAVELSGMALNLFNDLLSTEKECEK
ncbi:hypothetical protein [Lysinibacillus sp. F5]|uniref:hypothetical protein n=1 Tax=Lysinibacillus sp. F5 TaxID=1700846 RepID=UPI000738776A|nr:hypothetical protein [Lysinibacillus sp. F5]KUF37422.1 hypothetical protein AK833_00600 [Lysinibacillus sp. F5]